MTLVKFKKEIVKFLSSESGSIIKKKIMVVGALAMSAAAAQIAVAWHLSGNPGDHSCYAGVQAVNRTGYYQLTSPGCDTHCSCSDHISGDNGDHFSCNDDSLGTDTPGTQHLNNVVLSQTIANKLSMSHTHQIEHLYCGLTYGEQYTTCHIDDHVSNHCSGGGDHISNHVSGGSVSTTTKLECKNDWTGTCD